MTREVLELLFRIKSEGGDQVGKLRGAVQGLDGDLKNTAQSLASFDGSLAGAANVGNNLISTFRGMANPTAALTLGVGAAGVAIFGMAKATDELVEAQTNIGQRMGLNVREVAQLQRAAEETGVEFGALEASMRSLSNALSENDEDGKRAKKALAELGIETRNTFGGIRSTKDILVDLSDALGDIEDPAKRARLAMAVLGRGGLEFLPALRGNLRGTLTDLEQLNLGFSDQGVDAANRYGAALDQMGRRVEALKYRILGLSAVAVTDGIDAVSPGAKLSGVMLRTILKNRDRLADRVVGGSLFGLGAAALGGVPGPPSARQIPGPSSSDLQGQLDLGDRQREEAKEVAKQAAEEAAKIAKSRAEQILNLIRTLDAQGLDPLARLIFDTQARLADLVRQYGPLSVQQRGGVAAALSGAIGRQRRTVEPIGSDIRETGFQGFFVSPQAGTVEVDPAKTEQTIANLRERSLAAITRYADYQERIIALTAGPGGELQAIERIAEVREESARRQFEITKDQARLEADLDQIRKDREIQFAELQQRNLRQVEETARGIYRAGIASGRNGGLGSFVRGQANILGEQLFVNASSGIFRSLGGTLGKVGELSGLGGLLRGTIFDPANAQTREVDSRDRNTKAVDRLTATIQRRCCSVVDSRWRFGGFGGWRNPRSPDGRRRNLLGCKQKEPDDLLQRR
jgi:hypothetical protein